MAVALGWRPQLAATFIGVYGFNGYPNFQVNDAQSLVGQPLWGRDSFMGAGWPYAALACTCPPWRVAARRAAGRLALTTPFAHLLGRATLGIWCIIWYIPLDFIKIAFFYLTTPRTPARPTRLSLVKHASFHGPFAARSSIVQRVSTTRVI